MVADVRRPVDPDVDPGPRPPPDPQLLLCDPNPNSPANGEAAELFVKNKREYNKRVREIVEESLRDEEDEMAE